MKIRHGKSSVFFLLVIQAVLAYPAASQLGGNGLSPTSASALASVPQAEVVQERGPATSTPDLAAIQKAVAGVRSQDLRALASALGLSSEQVGQQAFEDSRNGLEAISTLGHGGNSVVAAKWQAANQGHSSRGESNLYLLCWTGESWQASYLMEAADALTLEALPGEESTAPLFAVVVYRGSTAVPYPVIFRLQDHHASLVWDGRSDSASYTGYDFGSIRFEKTGGDNVPVMITAGQADPGLLTFPVSQDQTGRGFQAATAYVWKNHAYIPLRTEYTHNQDYVLYRFIAALHLHDFKSAYSLVDPSQFLGTKQPSLELFRQRIQNVWPEFVDDRIFEVPAQPEIDPEVNVFILRLGDGRIDIYHPAFTAGPDYRLAGLQRFEGHE